MRLFLVLACFTATGVQADLYRWVDPQSGSVKYSSVPPPWYGDEERARRAPAVEVVPYRGPAGIAAHKEAPASPALAALESRWRSLLQGFSRIAPPEDFARAGRGIEKQLEAYQALAAELERQDPAGAARRRAEEASVMEKLQKGLQARFGDAAPESLPAASR